MHIILDVISFGDNFSDDEKPADEPPFDEQTGHKQPSDEQPGDEEPTTFINLVDSTSKSSDVILTHTSTVDEDVTKKIGIG